MLAPAAHGRWLQDTSSSMGTAAAFDGEGLPALTPTDSTVDPSISDSAPQTPSESPMPVRSSNSRDLEGVSGQRQPSRYLSLIHI